MNAKSSKKKSQTDWDSIDSLSDEEIDTSDIPLLDEAFFKNVELHMPARKQSITVRLDNDVLDWFRKQGKGYQTKMNAILRTYMKAHIK